MDDDLDNYASTSVKGSITLLIGNIVALIINAIGVILLARMLTPIDFGLFSVTLVLPGFFILFSDWGINQALVRFIAQFRSQKREHEIDAFVNTGIKFKFIVGTFLSVVLFLFADFLSTSTLHRPEITGLIRLVSILVVSQSLYSTLLSIFSGYEKMETRAILNVVQSIIKGVGSPLLVYFGHGLSGAVIGHVLSYVISAILGIIFVLRFDHPHDKQVGMFQTSLKRLLRFGLPLMLSGILLGFSVQFRGFLLSWYVSAELIGNYSVSSWFFIMVNVLSSSVSVNLFPAFSKINFYNDPIKGKEMFQGSIRYSSMFLLPFVFLIITISKSMIAVLLGNKYPQAPLFLILQLMHLLLIGFGSLSIVDFLNSQGDTKTSTWINVVYSILLIFLSITLIWKWSVVGFISAIILSNVIKSMLGLHAVHKLYGISPNLNHTFKTLLCGLLSMGITYSSTSFFSLSPIAELITSIMVFLSAYLVSAPFLGAIQIWDINFLDSMLKDFKMIYPFTSILLSFEEKLIQVKTFKEQK